VSDSQQTLARLAAIPLEEARPELRRLADQWEAITQVTLPNGQIATIDHSVLVARLRAEAPDLEELANLHVALLTTRSKWPGARFTPQSVEALKHILAQPEFQWQEDRPPTTIERWLQELSNAWNELLRRILSNLGMGDTAGTLSSYCLAGIGGLALILVIAFGLRYILSGFVAEAELPLDGEDEDNLTSEAALQRAQTLSNGGDYRTAVRYLYLSALLLLEERGLLRYDRSKTNREYIRSVAHLPALAANLQDVVEVFDRVWYGFQPLDESSYQRYAARVTDLRQKKTTV
jgi:hypothetical protein